jgi:dihydrofolate reductase
MTDYRLKLKAVVAMCTLNNGIGLNGTLPWRIPRDLKFFAHVTKYTKDKTRRNALIIGRKTWFSIPKQARPLPGRINIIISNTISSKSELDCNSLAKEDDIFIEKSFNDAIEFINNELRDKVESIFIVGGSQIYKEAFVHNDFDTLFLTRVNTHFDCDTYLEPDNFLKSFERINDINQVDAELINGFELNKTLTESNVEYVFEIYHKKV